MLTVEYEDGLSPAFFNDKPRLEAGLTIKSNLAVDGESSCPIDITIWDTKSETDQLVVTCETLFDLSAHGPKVVGSATVKASDILDCVYSHGVGSVLGYLCATIGAKDARLQFRASHRHLYARLLFKGISNPDEFVIQFDREQTRYLRSLINKIPLSKQEESDEMAREFTRSSK